MVVFQDVFILRSVSHSAGGGIIASREYFDIVGNFRDFDDGIYITCGKLEHILFQTVLCVCHVISSNWS